MEDILSELYKLRLDSLSDEWVQNIFDSEFLEYGEIPGEYEDILESLEIKAVFRATMSAIDTWLTSDFNNEEEKSWKVLSHQVKHQSLLALLAYYIDFGGKNVASKEYRNKALLASRFYYKLISIPGYKAYHIYHSQLFALSLLCLSYPKAMCESEETYFNTKELTREVNSIIKELNYLVRDLRGIISNLHLTSNDMNFEDILSNLVDITGGAIVNKLNIDKIELANLSAAIYEMIDILVCEPNGAPNASAIQLLFKCLLPKLIAASVDCRNANNVVRASYVTYSGLLLTKYGKAALSGYIVLLQHLCFTLDGLERAEVRSARVSLVVGLMSMLTGKSYKNFVKWLLKLSATAKVSHRQIALEMLAKLLNNDPELVKSNQSDEKKLITQTVSEDDKDKNITKGNNANGSVDNQNNEEPQPSTSAESHTNTAEHVTTEDESSQEPLDENIPEEEVAGLMRQRSHTIAHSEVLRAVYERVHDVSSTLRTRALAILTEGLQSEHPAVIEAIKELNGAGEVSRLAAIAARCVCDERAVVRKAAVMLLQRLITTTHSSARTPLASDYAMLVGLCRDASIVVRVAAVGALGEVAALRPDRAALDAFLAGPMHQLSDPETKIQEQVVSLIQQLLMERFKKYEPSEEDATPWLFLAGITRHKMRRHLQKACALLVKASNCINHRLVDLLSTHLGVLDDDRDLQCLVLLTSVARHVEYSDIGFLLDYYYNLTETQGRDGRLLPLTVELVAAWECGLAPTERAALRQHLVARLASAVDDGCRTACASLAAQLDPENLQWATELMQISERRALDGADASEWLRAADLSLVAPTPPSPQLLRLFLAALADPPSEWSAESRGLCVAGAGRLCVRSRAAAAALAPPLAALLRDAAAPQCARLNALLALTDICTRYSCIVEPLLDAVCGCVARGAAAALRRAAVRALTRLLLAGYLRLRTPLYYRYCALLADEDHDVREPAEYYVSCCLTVDTIYHHFVDCVLYYNNHETEAISFDARQLIYDIMLQRMSLVQKLNVQCRLAREVLQHAADVCDEREELPPALHAALLDTITLLCGPRMKLPKKPEKGGDADIDDLQERVTTNIVSHKMKRTVAEELVPGVLRLYAHMRGRGGQLAAYLVRIATDLLNDYQQEIEELIENDEELVERVQQFQETIGLEASFGNARNLVTASAPPEPDTPRARKRPARPARSPRTYAPKRRALKI